MIHSHTVSCDSDAWIDHTVHTREDLTRNRVTLRTWCGCSYGRSLLKSQGPISDANALRAEHREAREGHLRNARAYRDAIRKRIREQGR